MPQTILSLHRPSRQSTDDELLQDDEQDDHVDGGQQCAGRERTPVLGVGVGDEALEADGQCLGLRGLDERAGDDELVDGADEAQEAHNGEHGNCRVIVLRYPSW